MNRMREPHLRGVDLNLLVLLDALLTHRGVTRAAAAAHLSQPAMSRALLRLRHLLDDPLLVRGRDEAVLTPRALSLIEPVRRSLADIAGIVAPGVFDPAQWHATVTLAATDHQMILLLPHLMAQLSQAAPHLDVRVVPFLGSTIEPLRTGEVHMGFGVAAALPSGFRWDALYDDRLVTLMRRGHPKSGPLTRESFAALDHILVTVLGDGPGILDLALAEAGLTRRVALRLPHFYAALAVAAQSDLVVSLPVSIARRFADGFGLVITETPLASSGFTLSLIWPEALDRDPAQTWLRTAVRDASRHVREEGG